MFQILQETRELTITHEFEEYCRFCDQYLSDYKFGKGKVGVCLSCVSERKAIKKVNNIIRVNQTFRIL